MCCARNMKHLIKLITLLILMNLSIINSLPLNNVNGNLKDNKQHTTIKRGLDIITIGGGNSGFGDGTDAFNTKWYNGVNPSSHFNGQWFGVKSLPPSQAEVAATIAAAKQASANVLIAQQQVQAAKDQVFAQQRLATEKEAHAAIATQKSETQAAVQRSEASAAAQSVVLAQQRLAAAKGAVAQHQRIAAAKEAEAAVAIQNSARHAAVEIQRTEHEASKLSAIQRSDAAAALHHLSATKDMALAPITQGGNHASVSLPYNFSFGGPWPQTMGVAPHNNPWTNPPSVSNYYTDAQISSIKPSPYNQLWG